MCTVLLCKSHFSLEPQSLALSLQILVHQFPNFIPSFIHCLSPPQIKVKQAKQLSTVTILILYLEFLDVLSGDESLWAVTVHSYTCKWISFV